MTQQALVLLTAGFLVAVAQEEVIPQARPVQAWLKAAKEGDQELLKTVFSERMRKNFDKGGWDKVLKTYQDVFKKEFGDYQVADFTFEFTGTEEAGKVSAFHKAKKLPGLHVVNEKGEWKVDEH